MPTERYEVRAEPAVSDDLRELLAIDGRIVDSAIKLMSDLRDNPWLGEELRARPNLHVLENCRRIRFDIPDWSEKPRFRIVYRNEPLDGAPGLVRVWLVGARTDLVAYARAAARITRQQVRRRLR